PHGKRDDGGDDDGQHVLPHALLLWVLFRRPVTGRPTTPGDPMMTLRLGVLLSGYGWNTAAAHRRAAEGGYHPVVAQRFACPSAAPVTGSPKIGARGMRPELMISQVHPVHGWGGRRMRAVGSSRCR